MDDFTKHLIRGAGVTVGVVLVLWVAGKVLPDPGTQGVSVRF